MEEEILNNMDDKSNEIVEINDEDEVNNTLYDIEKVSNDNIKKSKKPSKWSNLSKKNKIIIIVSIVLVLVIIVLVILYFTLFKKDKVIDNEPVIVISKDNYRYEDGKLVILDDNKDVVGEYRCNNKNDSLCYVAYFSNEDNFDVSKKVYEDGSLINVRTDVIDNYVFIYDDETKEKGNVILYDLKEKKVVDTYTLVKEVRNKMIIVKKDNLYHLIDLSNNKVSDVIDKEYDYMGYILDTQYLVVSNNNNYSLIDFSGSDVSKSLPGRIMNFDEKKISVKVSDKCYVYNYDGDLLVNDGYDYIRFVNNYAIGVDNKKLYIYDNDGSPMNKEGIRITSNNYNTKLIFNDNLRQIGKEEAFDAIVTNNTMRVEFDSEVVKINLNDGRVSKNIPYISYYAGKLYFYSDEEKSNLLGTYKCEYANDVNEATKVLENCFIAKESNILASDKTNGYMPIYNNRYVFIADTKSPNANDNIILWDLKSNKKLATYTSVDAGFHDNDVMVNFISTAGTLVVAKNTSDSYGVINILNNDVKGIIPFKDENDKKIINVSFKQLGDNYLIKRSDETYHLYNKKGNELASKVTTKYEIVEYSYNHLMVKNSDKYLLYDLNGKIISDEYKYIKMENGIYLAIDSNNLLRIYKYDSRTNLLNKDVEIKDVTKDLNYEIKNDLLILTDPVNVGESIKVTIS